MRLELVLKMCSRSGVLIVRVARTWRRLLACGPSSEVKIWDEPPDLAVAWGSRGSALERQVFGKT
jgi:hypothetical protein